MSESPWYADGLQFTCTQCGDCCTGEPGCIWLDENELRAIADHTGMSIGEVKYQCCKIVGDRLSLREHANGDCVFLDAKTRRCSIYPVRPKQCRTWPFWNSNLQSRETWNAVQCRCPGAGQGEFVSLEEIREMAAQIDL